MEYIKRIFITGVILFSTHASATVINTIKGIEYEWLELTQTASMSRADIEVLLQDSTSSLYGYSYSSRALTADLLNSYVHWDISVSPSSSEYGATDKVIGADNFYNDFGLLTTNIYPQVSSVPTLDVGLVEADRAFNSVFFYGDDSECLSGVITGYETTCVGSFSSFGDANGVSAVTINSLFGFDSNAVLRDSLDIIRKSDSSIGAGSFLVREVSTVPVPATAWLFGSGLIGLVGFAKRKTRKYKN